MKISFLNQNDLSGGAARSAIRMFQEISRSPNIEAVFLVQNKKSDMQYVRCIDNLFHMLFTKIRYIIEKLYMLRKKTISLPWGYCLIPRLNMKSFFSENPDIFHMHWICEGFIPINSLLKLNRPVVWTLHDSWPFTGGCHIPLECTNYINGCGNCPQLIKGKKRDSSYKLVVKKTKCFSRCNITIVSPSTWLAKCAKSSLIFKDKNIYIIPNGLDVNVFKPINKDVAREILNLDKNKKYILFGAVRSTSSENKGFGFLMQALQACNNISKTETELIVFGASHSNTQDNMGFQINYLGTMYDDISLSLIYSVAHVLVVPSLSENLPNTAMESLACGTPVVAFNVGGIPDLVEHLSNGYLAKPYEPSDLANGIEWILNNNNYELLAAKARKKIIDGFDIVNVAKMYETLYAKVYNANQ